MRASISADTGRGPGNGIIEIFDAGNVSEPGFTLLRASDGKCLGPRGWQESETLLTPDAWDNDGGSLRLAVGPAVVDEVDNLDAYRISLRGVGSCALAVTSLVYSNIAGGHGMGAGAPLTPPPAPAPEPAPEPEPVLESPEPPLAFEEPQAPQQQEAPLEMASKEEGKSGGKAGLMLLLVLAAIAAGVAAWWFLLREPEKAPLTTPPEQTQNADKPQNPDQAQPKPADAGQQGADAAKQPLSPLASAREQLRGQALPDVSLAMAKPLRKADAKPEESDAAFLLLEDAAQKGDGEAMFLVGQFYDPASTLPRGSIPADLTQAKRWYDQALQKGQPQAKAALDTLKEHARALEAKGDAEARSLLQNWQ